MNPLRLSLNLFGSPGYTRFLRELDVSNSLAWLDGTSWVVQSTASSASCLGLAHSDSGMTRICSFVSGIRCESTFGVILSAGHEGDTDSGSAAEQSFRTPEYTYESTRVLLKKTFRS